MDAIMNKAAWFLVLSLGALVFPLPACGTDSAGDTVAQSRNSNRVQFVTERTGRSRPAPPSEGNEAHNGSSGTDWTERILLVCFLVQILAGAGLGCLVAIGLLSLRVHPFLLLFLGLVTGALLPFAGSHATVLRILCGTSFALLLVGLGSWAKRAYDALRAVLFVEADPYYASQTDYGWLPSQQPMGSFVDPTPPPPSPSWNASGSLMHAQQTTSSRPASRSSKAPRASSTGALRQCPRPVMRAKPKKKHAPIEWPSLRLPNIAITRQKPAKAPRPAPPAPPPATDAKGSLSLDE